MILVFIETQLLAVLIGPEVCFRVFVFRKEFVFAFVFVFCLVTNTANEYDRTIEPNYDLLRSDD